MKKEKPEVALGHRRKHVEINEAIDLLEGVVIPTINKMIRIAEVNQKRIDESYSINDMIDFANYSNCDGYVTHQEDVKDWKEWKRNNEGKKH